MRISKTLSISMPPAQYREMEKLAKKENRTLSELVREALRQYHEGRARPAINNELIAALRVVQDDAKRAGLDKLTMRQINAEVSGTRRAKRAKETIK
jgi:metal-responsive CopG/Arc/MetJ family transcriptional regulator